jgi:hypothetical protein
MDFTEAFKTPGGHMDPGASFPWQHYIELVVAAIDTLTPAPIQAAAAPVAVASADDSDLVTTCDDPNDVCVEAVFDPEHAT